MKIKKNDQKCFPEITIEFIIIYYLWANDNTEMESEVNNDLTFI